MSKCDVLAASVLVLWMPAIGMGQEPTLTPNLSAVQNILQDCRQRFADPRFAAIHDKVTALADTPAMSVPDLKPTPTELAALRALLPLVVDCQLKVQSDGFGKQRSAALLNLANAPTVGALALLASGRITYAEHAALLQETLKQLDAQYEAKVKEQDTLTLSCIVQSAPPQGQGMIGSEIQYTVDLVRQTVSGPGPPKNVLITPTEISFNHGDFSTTISRATGRFTTWYPQGPFASGTCEPVHATRF